MYNERGNVASLLNECQEALQAWCLAFEIIVVDDHSTDQTSAMVRKMQSQLANVVLYRHHHNAGQSAALYTGVRVAKYDWIATIDGDGQNNPHDIKKLVDYAQDHAKSGDLIAGRRHKRQDNWLRLMSSSIANGIRSRLLRDNCLDTGCGLKLFTKASFLRLPHFRNMHRFLPALYQRQGGAVFSVWVSHRERFNGQSKYGVMNRLWVGIIDLFGVMWLNKRSCYMSADEIVAENKSD